MCRNIKPLFNFSPPASDEEIKEASLQFIRKVSGFRKPSKINEIVFDDAVDKVSKDIKTLLNILTTDAPPHNRDIEARKAHAKALKRFGK